MKIYIISGLGADYKILKKLSFPENLEPVFIPWLIPNKNESSQSYVHRMASIIDTSQEFMLMGYSFGGFIVQEIHKIKPAKKIVILASIRSNKEMPNPALLAHKTRLAHYLPTSFFNEKTYEFYGFFSKMIGYSNTNVLDYFTVRDPYYLKWSLDKIVDWKFENTPDVIQIMGDKDEVFPLSKAKPEYIIKGGTHLFPIIKYAEVNAILDKILLEE